jgi:hypothetical protein
MVDLSLLQSVSYIAGAFGVCVAAFYYVMTLRVQQNNMKANLETRQAQFMNQISEGLTSVENTESLIKISEIEWTDWDDFERRWGSTGQNPAIAVMRYSVLGKFENLGWLLERGLLDPEWAYSQFHFWATPTWLRFKPWVMMMRERYNSPTIFIGFEYLGSRFLEIEGRKGIKPNYDV